MCAAADAASLIQPRSTRLLILSFDAAQANVVSSSSAATDAASYALSFDSVRASVAAYAASFSHAGAPLPMLLRPGLV
jgi:hypothetical protein